MPNFFNKEFYFLRKRINREKTFAFLTARLTRDIVLRVCSKRKLYSSPLQAPIEAQLCTGQAAGLSHGVKIEKILGNAVEESLRAWYNDTLFYSLMNHGG
jgi:hypothetical protein